MTATRPNSKRTPKRRVRNTDVVDDAAAAGMQIYGDIFAIPAAALDQSIKAALQAKDSLKGHVKRLVRRNSVTWEDDESDVRRDLLFAASRSRSAEELARIHRWATAKRDAELQQVVEARGTELRIPISKLKEGYPRGWNPQRTDRAVRKQKRNPESTAVHFYKKFHGRDSGEEIIIEQELHEHEHLGVIGTLAACVVDTPTGLRATLNFDSDDGNQIPWLCSSEDGDQLFIEGGCQEIDLKALEMNGKDWHKERMVIGQFAPPEGGRRWNLAYIAEKSFDDFETIRYEHDLGEPDEGEPKSHRREAPVLEYDSVNHLLFIVGGQYKIKLPLIGVSPGIEN